MQRFKNFVRNLLPSAIVEPLAFVYRRGRFVLISALYGFPGRSLNIIAVTGTNGKTTTSSFVASILEAAGYSVAVSSTAYFQIGDKKWVNDTNFTADHTRQVQKFLRRARRKNVDYVVFEVTAHGLDQWRGLFAMNYVAAVITNLTQDHLDYFGTMENYAAAKAKLLRKKPGAVILNRDDEWFEFFNDRVESEHAIAFGTDENAGCRITAAKLGAGGSEFSLNIDGTVKLDLKTKLVGRFNVYNATAAVATAYLLHIELDKIKAGVEALEAVPGRMEAIDEGQKFSVIVDYAHTADALANVLETLARLTKNRVILVFGATGDRDRAKRPDMGAVAAEYAQRIVLTDEEPYGEKPESIAKDVMNGIKKAKGEAKTHQELNRREAIKYAFKIARPGDAVVITGMGHQKYRTIGDKKIPWDDRDVARELLKSA